MIIDIILLILLVIAIIKGFQKGLIVALFSMVAFIIGIAAAIKLSVIAAGYIGQTIKVSDKWLPLISFVAVFIVVIILVRLGARLIEKAFQVAMLGWLNRLGGVLLFSILYILIYSVLLFYAEQVHLVKQETINSSVTYRYIEPFGPKVLEGFGTIIPMFRNMFVELENFFGRVSEKMQQS